jgi:hypothetical protein
MEKPNPLAAAFAHTRPEDKPEEDEAVPNAMATPKRRGKRGHTVYVDPAAHEAIKRIAKSRKVTLEDLWIEGMNYVLVNHGEKGIA